MSPVTIGSALQLLLFVIFGGVLILAVTYLAEFLIPLIAIVVAILIVYFAYKYLTSGKFTFP